MTTYSTIKAFLLAKLQGITDGTNTVLENVTDNPKLEFTGYPAAIIVPSDGDSDWETNSEDVRAYPFDIIIYDETQKQGISSAIDNLMNTIDYVLDSFASDKTLTGISLPTNKTMITAYPVASGWGEVGDNQLLAAVIKLKILISVSN